MRYFFIFIIVFFWSCKPEPVNQNINGLWVIDSKENYPDHMEFAIIGDSVHFKFPMISFQHKLTLKKDSILILDHYTLFKIRPHSITMNFIDSTVVKFIRPSVQQLDIGYNARRFIYKVSKLDIPLSEKNETINYCLDRAYRSCDE